MWRLLLCLHGLAALVQGQTVPPVRWCTISPPEKSKCEDLALALLKVPPRPSKQSITLECPQVTSHEECMVLLDQGEADLVALNPNEIFIGGRYHSLVPLMKESYDGGRKNYYSVAVTHKGNLTHVRSLADLKDTVACFPSVASMGGWVIPIAKLIHSGAMEVVDCNNHVKSASEFFKGGCAVNILSNKYNPLGDNSQVLCSACGSELPGQHCTNLDNYAGNQGALECLLDQGQIAFVKHATLTRFLNRSATHTPEDFELICDDGGHAPISDFRRCNWGVVPSNAIVTTSAKSKEQRRLLQEFLKDIVTLFGNKTDNTYYKFHLFESAPKYGLAHDLLLSDDTEALVELTASQQSFQKYLTGDIVNHIQTIRSCPVTRMKLCVTSMVEYSKCLQMKTALHAQLLKPEMECLRGESNFDCMASIRKGEADVSVFEAGDIYSAGLLHELVPIMAEQYNLDTLEYYVVAVSKEDDPDTDVLYLRGRMTCHPGVMHGGGWVVPMAYLINNDLIRQYQCNSVRAASEYFMKSCVPGALSTYYREDSIHLNLCHLCRGQGQGYCARDHSEPYYGFTGAFRCLVEGGGDIAFVKHTTVKENVDGRRKEFWARNQLTADYQLVCRDGTRAPVTDYEDCNLGTVRSNAVVTRGGALYNVTEVQAYTNLFLYAQQHFGRDSEDEWNFNMFHSPEPYADLIFQDATQQLVPLDLEEQHYHPYLGMEFLNARYEVDCTAGSLPLLAPHPMLLLLLALLGARTAPGLLSLAA
ncbi:melanotransferrin-like [Eriocheir sinensis]|uniref:melanotransferrin-like n=1 Tax=Eriocheir sinensis TaxID=95602 RepID=UPI0021C816E4|nr:melanotransferrin-like [Eriocheir sinensis]